MKRFQLLAKNLRSVTSKGVRKYFYMPMRNVANGITMTKYQKYAKEGLVKY